MSLFFFCSFYSAEVKTSKINMNGLVESFKQELTFDDIVVEINKKTILDNVWGTVSSGELMAVMGPSGELFSFILNSF